ncbi:ATP-grasp domain-containing protein [Deinococcus lacus]|uniref:ATP-grasp domain-containing protein n=1 Tax=Deinococcus lacus TaxID=392561 RepID=A0ABW1YAY9_9DEIO
MHVLVPADYFHPKTPDAEFADQAAAFAEAGHSVGVWPLPAGTVLNGRVLYRGWMLTGEEYTELAQAVTGAGGEPVTTPEQYLAAHHLPNWAGKLAGLTPETRCWPAEALTDVDGLRAEMAALGWGEYFVKDYVKSLKTGRRSILRDLTELDALLTDMEQFRGRIEGGLCVRRVEDFLPDTERRFFVWRGKAFAPAGADIPKILQEVAERIDLPFYSVDVVQRTDGTERVVEIGDGQVSDVVGWEVGELVRILG